MKRYIVSDERQRGAVLLVTMMILLILTVMGIAAISTTTTEIRIAGNAKLQNTVFYGADGGGRIAIPILKSSLDNRVVPAGPVLDSNLINEIEGITPNDGATDDPVNSPDIQMVVGGVTVGVDIDRLESHGAFSAGGAIEFASGYEGIGVGMSGGGGGIGFHFGINSIGGIGPSQSHVYQEYTHFLR